MAMLFKVTDKDIFDDNPYLKAIDEFKSLTSEEIKYIALSRDFQGPFRRLDKKDREEKALRALSLTDTDLGDSLVALEEEKYINAAQAYDHLQGWSELKMLSGLDACLSRFNELLAAPTTEVDDQIKIAKELPALLKKRQEILKIGEEELEVSEDDSITGDNVIDRDEVEGVDEESRLDQINT